VGQHELATTDRLQAGDQLRRAERHRLQYSR
jgi:hypothetical protein